MVANLVLGICDCKMKSKKNRIVGMRIETEPNCENPEQFQPYIQASATTTPSGLVHNILPYTL